MSSEFMDNQEVRETEPTQTEWAVLIGPPASGKSTSFDAISPILEREGWRPILEVERTIIEEDRKRGIERDPTREGHIKLEGRFLKAREELEKSLDPSSKAIMDRGIVDIVAYLRFYGADETAATLASKRFKYSKVFYLEPLASYEQDVVRVENVEFAKWMHENLPKVYEELGYSLISVPVFPYGEGRYGSDDERREDSIGQRRKFMLEQLRIPYE